MDQDPYWMFKTDPNDQHVQERMRESRLPNVYCYDLSLRRVLDFYIAATDPTGTIRARSFKDNAEVNQFVVRMVAGHLMAGNEQSEEVARYAEEFYRSGLLTELLGAITAVRVRNGLIGDREEDDLFMSEHIEHLVGKTGVACKLSEINRLANEQARRCTVLEGRELQEAEAVGYMRFLYGNPILTEEGDIVFNVEAGKTWVVPPNGVNNWLAEAFGKNLRIMIQDEPARRFAKILLAIASFWNDTSGLAEGKPLGWAALTRDARLPHCCSAISNLEILRKRCAGCEIPQDVFRACRKIISHFWLEGTM